MVHHTEPVKRPIGLAVFFIIGGAIALTAAFLLTLDKFAILEDPQAQLSCNFSVLVGCSTNLGSWQGAILGFPNPLIGLMAWTVVITIGAAILAGAQFSRWFWVALNVGLTGALAFVIWLMAQSFFVLDVLCPWCMVTWTITIPMFLAVTLHNLTAGNLPASPAVRRMAATAYSWIVVITIVCYLLAAVIAQLEMDFLHRL
ncbi:vitamin K epoxide reductase family protein [Cryobacterium breve]|uniref:Vitamin K epoxide reductase family protein n=1 Tax=Cryobacterium breve TaxID=1259258 RepID=A0ABY2J5M0_9MICO|nr:vitamin K epoxide reductase family protein [Cryobacterium sp. TmT3-12]TFD00175.1 vitamin K epoxide reductase family protein [Cryobacterium breve]